jgi:hypothetical protein
MPLVVLSAVPIPFEMPSAVKMALVVLSFLYTPPAGQATADSFVDGAGGNG